MICTLLFNLLFIRNVVLPQLSRNSRMGELLSPTNPQHSARKSSFSPFQHSNTLNLEKLQQFQLLKKQKQLQHSIQEAKQQQALMIDLFESMAQLQRGEEKKLKKCKRRCPQDIVERHQCPHQNCSRFYSSDSSLKRDIRLKHDQFGDDPPQKYHTLHPEPELSVQLYFSGVESEVQQGSKEKGSKKIDYFSIKVGCK